MSIGSRTDDASSKLILPGVQKNKMYSIIEWIVIMGCTSISHI